MELMPVKIEILVKANQAYAEFRKVNGELDRMAIKGDLAGNSMGRWTRASKLAGTAMLGLAGVASLVGYESVKAAIAMQKSQSNLQVAVKNSGVAYSAAKPQIESHTEAMANLGFTTEDTYTALAHMTAATRSPQMALNALAITADLARFKQISLAQASDIVSRASMGQARGLASLGLAIGKTIPKGADFAQIMALIEKRTRGAALAFAQTSAGHLEVLRAKFKALQEQLGTALLPTLSKVSDWFVKKGLPDLKGFGGWVSRNTGLVKALGIAMGTIWAVPKIAGFITAMEKLYAILRPIGVILGTVEAGAAGALAFAGGADVMMLNAYKNFVTDKTPDTGIMDTTGKYLGSYSSLALQGKNAKIYRPGGSPVLPLGVSPYLPTKKKIDLHPNLHGLGPAPLINNSKSKHHKAKHESLRSQARQKVGDASGTTVHTNIHLDSKVVASSVANSATHGTPLSSGRRSGG